MGTRTLFIWLNSATILGLLLAGCSPALPPAATTTPAPSPSKQAGAPPTAAAPALSPVAKDGQQPKTGGILNVVAYDSLPHYDIHQNQNGLGLWPYQHAYNNLIQYSATEPEKIVADLAQTWDVSADGTVYTFHLLKGVKWHDGKPFTSADAKVSLDRMYDPPKGVVGSKIGELIKSIKSVQAPDADTLKVTLNSASASFIPTIASSWSPVFPKHVLEEKGDMKRTMIGTGPFKFKGEVPGSTFELDKNKEYFRQGRPYLDGIKYFVIKDAATRFAAFRTKRVQLTSPAYGFLPAQLEQVKREMAGVGAAQFEGGNSVAYFFLTTKRPWSDVRVRKAIDLAIDRQEAVRTVEEGIGIVAGPMPPGPWALPQDEVSKLPGYRQPKDQDRAEARRLLSDAGYGGLKFTMLYRTGRAYESAAEFFKDQMAKIGVDVTLKPMEYIALYDLLLRHDFDAAQMKMAWTVNDPDDVLLQYNRSKAARNFADFGDPEIDKLIDEQAILLDQAKRKETVLKLQRQIIGKVPYVTSHFGNYVMGWLPEVKNFTKPLGMYTYWRLEDVWLAR